MATKEAAKKMTKAQTVSELAEKTGLNKKQASEVLDKLRDIASRELGKKGPGVFEVPGLVRLKVRETQAQKNKEFRNPTTGEKFFKDVPKSRKLRATAVKALRDAVAPKA